MPQYFQHRCTALGRLVFFGGPLYVAGLIWIVSQVAYSPYMTGVGVPVEQPVPFSHEHHVGRLRLDCRYCHETVEETAFAGLPSTDVCVGCHSQLWRGLPDVEPVISSYRTKIPLAWHRVHDLPDFSFFDHSIHVQKGIGCVTCHGRVDQMPLVEQAETLRMEWCLECHRQPERFVRPREYVFDMDWRPPEDVAALQNLAEMLEIDPPPATHSELQSALMAKYRIQRRTSCSNCHQ